MASPFTNTSVRSLKPTDREYSRRDGSHPGLAIRVHPSGRKTWVFFYDHRGHRRRLTLGHYPQMGLREARDRYREAAAYRDDGKDPAREQKAHRDALHETPTVDQFAQTYLENHAKRHKKTWTEDERILRKDVIPPWRGLLISEIRRRDVAQLLDSIAARGAPFSANAAQVVLSAMFNFAVEREYVPANPAAGLRKRGRYRPRDRELSETEVGLFFDALHQAGEPKSKIALYLLQLLTATRPGEVRFARWSEFDLQARTWTLPGARTKNQRAHQIPLSDFGIEVLRGIPRSTSPWLFPSRITDGPIGKYNQADTIRRLFVRGRLEIERFTPHDLRRTAATNMARLGVERMVISKILNHADEHQTATYDRYTYIEEKRQALDQWADRLDKIVTVD